MPDVFTLIDHDIDIPKNVSECQSWVPALAALTQQVLIECPVMRLPLSPHLA